MSRKEWSAGEGPGVRATALLASGLLLLGCRGTQERPKEPPRPSVVLISIDTLRADHLGCYGYEHPTSPYLDSLAASGVVMEEAISSAPWTLPSHASMLTGVSPATHRAVEGTEGIAPSVRLAAELFRQAGYATAGFVSSWFVSRHYGFQRGFDRFVDFGQTQKLNTARKIRADQVVAEAGRWLGDHGKNPFFLLVHFYDVHFDYDPPPEDRRLFATGYKGPEPRYRKYSYYQEHPLSPELLAHEMALYDGEIHRVDRAIRQLLEILRDSVPPTQQTLVVVTADHGEEFFERGSWGHAHTLYDEQVHVPLIFAGGGLPAGVRIRSQVRQIDLLPTLLAACRLPVPPQVEGTSYWSALQGEGSVTETRRPAFMETSRFETNLIGLREGGWKLVRDLVSGREQLFHLDRDPGEEEDRAGVSRTRLKTMQDDLELLAATALPDRWFIRWNASGKEDLRGRLVTSGSFLKTRFMGISGEIRRQGRKGLEFRLPPGGSLEIALWPVDAVLEMPSPPRSAGRDVVVVLGRRSQQAAFPDLRLSAHAAETLRGLPTPAPPSAALWMEQEQKSGSAVSLSPEDRRRLESLGYAFAGGSENARESRSAQPRP